MALGAYGSLPKKLTTVNFFVDKFGISNFHRAINMKSAKDKLSEAKEDYLETILMLSKDGQPARLVDIAKAHGVSKATVSNALAELGRKGYIAYEKYRPVYLTKKGGEVASRTLGKHELLIRFLTENLGVSHAEAEEAACKMEHAIGADIAFKLAKFMESLARGAKQASPKVSSKKTESRAKTGGRGK